MNESTVYHWVWCSCRSCQADRRKEIVQKLITLSAWRELPPKTQGYVWYMQAELPGSELKGLTGPHPDTGIEARAAYEEGIRQGILEAQDSEE